MKILLVAMPETIAFLDRAIRVPNLGLASLAGNLPGHDVLTLDLTCEPRCARRLFEDTIMGFESTRPPELWQMAYPDAGGSYDGFTCNVRTRHLSRTELERTVHRAKVRTAVDPRMVSHNRLLRRHGVRCARAHLDSLHDELAHRFGRDGGAAESFPP